MTPEGLELSRMEETRRQIQRQLDLIDRQITRRMTAIMLELRPKHAAYYRGRAPDPSAFLARYRSRLAAITAERQPEIDALSRQLARQDANIAAFCARNGLHAYAASDGQIAPRLSQSQA